LKRSIIFRTLPRITYCVVTTDAELVIVGASIREDGAALDDGNLRMPINIASVDGVDPIEALPDAVEAEQPRIVHVTAEWNEKDGCWDVSTVDRIDDPRAVSIPTVLFDDARDVTLRLIEIDEDKLKALITITVPIEGLADRALDSAVAVHDDVIGPLDDIDDEHWRVDVLDHDEGPKLAWWNVMVTAKSGGAIHDLDEALARRTPWQRVIKDATRAG
jgi:hypothetical protein